MVSVEYWKYMKRLFEFSKVAAILLALCMSLLSLFQIQSLRRELNVDSLIVTQNTIIGDSQDCTKIDARCTGIDIKKLSASLIEQSNLDKNSK